MSSLFGPKKKKNKVARGVVAAAAPAAPVVAAPTPRVPEHDDDDDDDADVVVVTDFARLGLSPQLVAACRGLGFRRPTAVQRAVIPAVLGGGHVLALAATGSGKTAAYALPVLHRLAEDPYGIYAVILTPTRELAKQVREQVTALGAPLRTIVTALVTGGSDQVRQSCALARRPHFVIATPGRLAELLRGADPPHLHRLRFLVLDEADRLLTTGTGFERDVAEILRSVRSGGDDDPRRSKRTPCQTLLLSATMTGSLQEMARLAAGNDNTHQLKLQHIVVTEKDHVQKQNHTTEKEETGLTASRIPAGLKQEYIFMPSRVRDTYLVSTIRLLVYKGGRKDHRPNNHHNHRRRPSSSSDDSDDEEDPHDKKARSAIVFVSTCERCGYVARLLTELGIDCIALHSLLTQNRRLASLERFKSRRSRVLVATDVAGRGLDLPCVDLVINAHLPLKPVDYVHRVGRTARAGRRGRAVSLVGERDVALVQACETASGRELTKNLVVTEEAAVALLGAVAKAGRLAKLQLLEVGFDDLVRKQRERKSRDRRRRAEVDRRVGDGRAVVVAAPPAGEKRKR